MVTEAASLLGRAAAFPRGLGVASRPVLAAGSRQDLAAAAQLVHVVDCPPDHARGLTRGEMGCCRFQRHRVRCMNEPKDEAWNDGSLRESSDRGGKARVAQGGVNEIGSSPVSQER